ncbi:MAG: hypothetical protein ACR2IH_06025 [Pyrinomonadaceae bacterium]
MRIISLISLLAFFVFLGFACNKTETPDSGAVSSGSSPTESYKLLFAAVKSKNTDAIKNQVSGATKDLAVFAAEKQKSPVEKVYENGFTATTFADSLPEIRDERIDGNMGAIEVRNVKDATWEDLPYVKEETGWKLAVGDVFKGTFKSPGEGRAVIEQEAANAAGKGPQEVAPFSNSNLNVMSNSKMNSVKPMLAPKR